MPGSAGTFECFCIVAPAAFVVPKNQALACVAPASSRAETGACLTQIVNYMLLAPDVQPHIVSMPEIVRRPAITERALRPTGQIDDQRQQLATFPELLQAEIS